MNHKNNNHNTKGVVSPYIQLLRYKNKVYGHKYDLNGKIAGQVDKLRSNTTSLFNDNNKQYKSLSSEKVKLNKSQHTKKKRSNTQQIQDRMHQSLYINMEKEKAFTHQTTKSLFNNEPNKDFINDLQQVEKKNYGKMKQKEKKINLQKIKSQGLEELQIQEIDNLISLIDNCVQQANQYITYLINKMNEVKEELVVCKNLEFQLKKQLEIKNEIIKEKQIEIQKLRRTKNQNHQIYDAKSLGGESFQMKKLFQLIESMSKENKHLKERLKNHQNHFEQKQAFKTQQQIYKQIHSKIDILNISIDSKNQSGKIQNKKYKFIKPRNK